MTEDKASLDTITPMPETVADPLWAPNKMFRNDAGEPISLMESALLLGTDRHVARTHLSVWEVSTVFIPSNMNYDPNGPPILWETMIFGPAPFDGVTANRYASRAAARRGHLTAVQQVMDWTWGATPVPRQHGMMRHLRSVRRSLLHLGQLRLPRSPKWGSTIVGTWTMKVSVHTTNNNE